MRRHRGQCFRKDMFSLKGLIGATSSGDARPRRPSSRCIAARWAAAAAGAADGVVVPVPRMVVAPRAVPRGRRRASRSSSLPVCAAANVADVPAADAEKQPAAGVTGSCRPRDGGGMRERWCVGERWRGGAPAMAWGCTSDGAGMLVRWCGDARVMVWVWTSDGAWVSDGVGTHKRGCGRRRVERAPAGGAARAACARREPASPPSELALPPSWPSLRAGPPSDVPDAITRLLPPGFVQ
eukprot:gene11176-biopygen11952